MNARPNDSYVPGQMFETSYDEDMDAFDQLPAPIRAAIRAHPHQVAAEPILAAWTDPDFRQDLDCIERMDFVLDEIRNYRP